MDPCSALRPIAIGLGPHALRYDWTAHYHIGGACLFVPLGMLTGNKSPRTCETQIAKEADELEHTPDAEEHELRLIDRATGSDSDEKKRVASQVTRKEDKALEALTSKERGPDPAGDPRSPAGVSFFLLRLGRSFPPCRFCGRPL